MAHTPGPWKTLEQLKSLGSHSFTAEGFTEYHKWDAIPISSAEGHGLGYVNCWHDESRESEANARLMAAAPELLEACKVALMQFEHNGNECPEDAVVLDMLEAVIAKAKGE